MKYILIFALLFSLCMACKDEENLPLSTIKNAPLSAKFNNNYWYAADTSIEAVYFHDHLSIWSQSMQNILEIDVENPVVGENDLQGHDRSYIQYDEFITPHTGIGKQTSLGSVSLSLLDTLNGVVNGAFNATVIFEEPYGKTVKIEEGIINNIKLKKLFCEVDHETITGKNFDLTGKWFLVSIQKTDMDTVLHPPCNRELWLEFSEDKNVNERTPYSKNLLGSTGINWFGGSYEVGENNEKNIWIDVTEITLAYGGEWEVHYQEVFLDIIRQKFSYSIDKNLLSLENPEEGVNILFFRSE